MIDMDPPEVLSVYDLSFRVSEAAALTLMKDTQVRFQGTIVKVTEVIGSCSIDLADTV